MSELNNLDETIEQSIMTKVKNFFDLHKRMRYEQLNDFLDSISLADVFGMDEEKEIIWTIFSEISNGAKEIDYETCKKGMVELFAFYGITPSEDKRENMDDNFFTNINNNTTGNNATSPKGMTSFRESLQNKEKKLDELLTRISLMNTPSKIPHYNTPIPTNKDKLITNTLEEDLVANTNNPSRSNHRRQITKVFTAIDIDKLQQLRKVFSLLDLRNKDNVYISELQEVIRKYKFIKLTQEELINFLSLISNDLKGQEQDFSNKSLLKLSINFELYSRAISAIEQQLLKHNSDTFTERNDSYEINENCQEMIQDVISLELDNVDYVMVLADILKSLEYRVKDSIVANYEKIVGNKYNLNLNENEETVKENFREGIMCFKNKLKDVEIFLKEMNQTSTKKQNKLEYLKLVVGRLENSLKVAEDDYRNLFQKFNTCQPVEISDETEKLFEENKILHEQRMIKENLIERLDKEIYDKDEQIFNLSSKLDTQMNKENVLNANYKHLKNEYDALQKNYDVLLNDIYDKIQKEEETLITQGISKPYSQNTTANSSSNNNHNINKSLAEKDTVMKIKEKLGTTITDESKKVFEMNYEQLVLYTVKVENINKQLEDKNSFYQKRIKDLERELSEMTNNNNENAKNLYLSKSENLRLQNKINDLNKDIEINSIFRPSTVLGNRISMSSRKSDINSVQGRFNKMQKIFEADSKKDVRTSEVNLESNPIVNINTNVVPSKIQKLTAENVDSSQVTANPNAKFNPNPNANNIFKQDTTNNSYSITNPNAIFSFNQKDSFSYNYNEKFLFEDKEENKDYTQHNDRINTNLMIADYFDNENADNPSDAEQLEININDNEADKEIIIDYIDESPFTSKDEDKLNINVFSTHQYNLNDSVEMKAIDRHSPFEIEVNSEKRKLFKQLSKENLADIIKNTSIPNLPQMGLTATANANASSKKLMKIPSQITEEILEEDINGEIIGSSSGMSNQIMRTSTTSSGAFNMKNMNDNNNNVQQEEKKNLGHNRGVTMEDLGLVFNKDSQFMCYDFLTLRKTEAIIKMFEDNREDVSSYEMFSDNVYLIDENNKKSKKYLFITSNFVYILRPYDLSQKLRINLMNLDKLTISNKNCNLIAFHFKEGDDLLLEILRRMELLYFFRDLYRMKRYGKLKFKYSDNFKIKRNNTFSNIIVDQANNFFIAPNFDGAQKLGYLSKLTGTFFTKFNEKLVVLTNVGLLYFDDPNKAPKKLIPIIGSDVIRLDEKKYKKKHCFEIKTLNGESYVFATNSKEDLESWVLEFKTFKKNYEKKIKNIDIKK